jgi:serine/threonine-protein kinase
VLHARPREQVGSPTCVRINGRRYRVTAQLAGGGNAVVCVARDGAGRRVVLKRPRSCLDEEDEALFADECRIALAVRHPHLVRAIDSGRDARTRTPYLVSQYVSGRPLSAALGAAREGDVAGYLLQALQACAYLAARGIAHCDLKPANMLVAGGVLTMGDFGVATCHGAPLKGMSLAFVAPEHLCAAAPACAATDLYSLGVSFYWLLTGVHPYCTSGLLTDLNAACSTCRPAAPTVLNRTLDPRWDAVLLGLIDRAPRQRVDVAARVRAAPLRELPLAPR